MEERHAPCRFHDPTCSRRFCGSSFASLRRAVTDQERAKLEDALKAPGCSGCKLEFDDGKFEVDDAACADGKKYDLDFDQSFVLIKKKRD
ncbi:MAG: PepSY domain-containing protein [Proteobacteria bacterium]|nr:PepSY domain-containing protein [Pseudomonadota bacterium]